MEKDGDRVYLRQRERERKMNRYGDKQRDKEIERWKIER
jgi:hypothetical protein